MAQATVKMASPYQMKGKEVAHTYINGASTWDGADVFFVKDVYAGAPGLTIVLPIKRTKWHSTAWQSSAGLPK